MTVAIGSRSATLLLLAALLTSHAAVGDETISGWSEVIDFSIPAQSAGGALKAYAAQANVQVLFPHESVRNVQAAALERRASRAEALQILLAGTGLEASLGPKDTATVRRAAPAVTAAVGSPLLAQNSDSAAVASDQAAQVTTPTETAVTATGSGEVTGTVRLPGGAAAQGVLVTVTGTRVRTYTDQRGRYVLRGVPAGSQELLLQSTSSPDIRRSVVVESGTSQQVDVVFDQASMEGVMLDEVIVTGESRLLSLQAERTYVGKKNVITSTKIGQFPDKNAAEAASRLPGVNIDLTDKGEGRFVSIRGAPPTFNRVKMNGILIGSTELNGQSVPLDVFPAGQIGEIQVTKSVLPSEDANSIGGEINLSLPSAFGKEPSTQLEVKVGQADLGPNTDRYGASFSSSRMLGADDQFGLTVSAHFDQRELTAEAIRVSDWDLTDDVTGFGDVYAIDDQELRNYENERRNTSVSVVFEWQPSEATTLFLQGSLNKFDEEEIRHRYIQELDDGGALQDDGSVIVRPASSGPGSVVRATFSDIRNTRREWQVDDTPQAMALFSVGGETKLPNWRFEYKAGYSDTSEHRRIDVLDFPMNRGAVVTFDASQDALRPRLTPVSGPNPFDGNEYTLGRLSKTKSFRDDEVATLDGSAARWIDLSEGRALELAFGVRATLRERGLDEDDVRWDGGSTLSLADPRIAFNDINRNLLNVYDFGPSVRREDVGFLFDDPDAFLTFNADQTRIDGAISDYTADEDVYAGFLQAKYLVGPVTLVGGVRVERTDVEVAGFGVTEDEDLVELRDSNAYTDWFPSIHLRWDMPNDVVFRASATRTLARPLFSDLAPAAEIDLAAQEISIGNVELEPFYSNNYDLSVDWYSEKYGTIGAALFYKDIDGFVVDTEDTVVGGPYDGFTRSSVANAEKGWIQGVEFIYTTDLKRLQGWWSGLGLSINFALIDSEVDFPASGPGARSIPGESVRIAGQADYTGNIALWYASERFFAQLALSSVGESIESYGDSNEDRINDGNDWLSFKAIYTFSDRYAVELNWANITDERLWFNLGDRARMRDYERSGPTVDLAFRVTF